MKTLEEIKKQEFIFLTWEQLRHLEWRKVKSRSDIDISFYMEEVEELKKCRQQLITFMEKFIEIYGIEEYKKFIGKIK
jgi:hypothetical protein